LIALLSASNCWLQCFGADTVESYGVRLTDRPQSTVQRFWEALPEGHLDFIESSVFSHRIGRYVFTHAGLNPALPLDRQRTMQLIWGCPGFLEATWLPEGVTAVHGHYAARDAQIGRTAVAINADTGAGYLGGRLSAVALDPDGTVEVFQTGPAADGQVDIPYRAAAST
jgi:serine/threonine protein phosphatase 1